MSVAGWVNDDERGGWVHCDRPGWLNDEGVTCSKCQASFAWDERPEWVVLSITEDVSARVDGQTYVVPLDALGVIERELLNDCESFGWYSPEAADVARRVGVPMSEMVDAFQLVSKLRESGELVRVLEWVAQWEADQVDDEDDSETQCADCFDDDPAGGWAEEAPGFRLCFGCASDRAGVEA